MSYSAGVSRSAPEREKASRSAPDDARVLRNRANQRYRRLHRPPLHDGALEVARHGVAQPAQDLRRRVALLLRVDHVALGEHRAASGDPRRASWPCERSRRPPPLSTACAAPADRGTTRYPPRTRPTGHNPRCCRHRAGCTSSFPRRFRTPCAPAGRPSPSSARWL